MSIRTSMYGYIRSRYAGDNREVMNYYGKPVSGDEFYRDIDKLADYLSYIGVQRGDSVVICLPNMPNSAIAFYAINKIGAIADIVHPLMPPLGLQKILEQIPPKAIFMNDVFYRKYANILKNYNVILCSMADYMPMYLKLPFKFGVGITLLNVRCKRFKGIIRNPILQDTYNRQVNKTTVNNHRNSFGLDSNCDEGQAVAAYLHSGGTTGEPKTVMLTNSALNAVARNINSLNGEKLLPGTSMLMVLPLFHVFGLGVCLHSAMAAGARSLVLPYFKAKQTCRVMKKQRVTFVTGVSNMYDKMLNCKTFYGDYLKDIKYCYCGGDRLPKRIIDRFAKVMEKYDSECVLSEGYGLTEAGICTVNTADAYADNSVGLPIGGVKILICDNGKILNCYERGEICIGGDSVMKGYYDDKDTAQRVLFEYEGVKYVRTGDIGYLDDTGHLYYVERLKRMIKISGINVFPSEIEKIVSDNFAFIKGAAAIRRYNNSGKGYIHLLLLMREGEILTEERIADIRKTIGKNLMHYSVPRIISETNKLPYTAIGKVDYKTLENQIN